MANINLGRVSPLAVGEYDSTIVYDKLDIVNYQGSSYIAKKGVPAGTSITNDEYWQLLVKGAAPLNIGTVNTVSANTGASASITGTYEEPVLNLNIPRGIAGNESIDDTAGEWDTDKVWSADKSYRETIDLKNSINEKYRRTGLVQEYLKLEDFTFPGNEFYVTNIKTYQGHRYTITFLPLSNNVQFSVGSITPTGSTVGIINFFGQMRTGSFISSSDGKLFLRQSVGDAITTSIYIYDTTDNDNLLYFIEKYKTETKTTPYDGMGGFIINRYDKFVGENVSPEIKLQNVSLPDTSTYYNCNYETKENNRYSVVFTKQNQTVQITCGSLYAGALRGSQLVYGDTGIATFTAEVDGKLYIKLSFGSNVNINDVHIYNTTNNDELLSFITSHMLLSDSILYNGIIENTYKTWYKNKNFTSFGDSITYQNRWQPFINNAFTFSTLTNCGIGGTKVGGTDQNSFWQDVRINAIPLTTDFITIMGGTNDGQAQTPLGTLSRDNHDINTFIGAYNVLISKIFYKFSDSINGYYQDIDYSGITQVTEEKTIHIMLITCGFCSKTSAAGSDFSRMEGYANACIEIGKLWGLPVADIYHNAGINPINVTTYLPDEVHPDINGAKLLASIIIGKMRDIEPIA